MIILLHSDNETFDVIRDGSSLDITERLAVYQMISLAHKYPEDIILWVNKEYYDAVNMVELLNLFHHNRLMMSYSLSKEDFFHSKLGYVDQSVFVKINYEVRYPTWLMSTDVGMILSKTLVQLSKGVPTHKNLGFYLNSISRKGQLCGLIVYSEPRLIKHGNVHICEKSEKIDIALLFDFVGNNYKKHWVVFLFFCLLRYEKVFALRSLLRNITASQNKNSIDLSDITIKSRKIISQNNDIDVIIPTMGRKQYLEDVLKDLSVQSMLPKKVIIVEQNPDTNSTSELDYLSTIKWPYKIIHKFIHQTGACNARNIALSETSSPWVILGDDDNRLGPEVLKDLICTATKYGVESVTTKYIQPHESSNYNITNQTSIFGSGNSLIHSSILEKSTFDLSYEFGYGEDSDFGMQIRNSGFDVIYDADITITHLKAPMGGFRKQVEHLWSKEEVLPSPSPTIMVFALKHKTKEQFKGYRLLFLIRKIKSIKPFNIFKFYRKFNLQWGNSKYWAQQCMEKS